ncbi:MAG: hypothetical protein ACXWP4_20650, partial [Polyangiales bacterium]
MKRLVALVALSLASCRAEMTTIGTASVTGGVWSVVDSPGDFRHYRALWVDAQNRPYTIGVPILPPDDAGVDSPPVEAALDTPEPVDAAVDASMPETLTFDVGMPSMEFPIRSVLLRRDDTGWTDVGDLPMVANAVWAAAPGVACAAGTDSFACTPGFALEQPKEWADFTAIWAASVDHVWFGGTSIVEKTDGMHIETALAPADRILSMWGSSVSDLWAVSEASVIRHWDGAEWSAQSSGVELSLRAVWGTGANDVWTVGDGGTVLHFDG